MSLLKKRSIDVSSQKSLKVQGATDMRKESSVFEGLIFKERKNSGANSGGEYGGVYSDKDGNLSMIKKENASSKNISEFLGSQIFQTLSPGSGAYVSLIAPNFLNKGLHQKDGIQNDGSAIYIKSDYIKNYSADMYVDMDKHMSVETKPSKLFRISGDAQKLGRPLFAGSRGLLNRAFKEIPYKNFEKIAPASLLIGDFDIHTGNIGVIRDPSNPSNEPKLVRIDFAASLDKLEKNIYSSSWSRHLPLFGPTNHFREFPDSLKNNDLFAENLLETSKINLDETIDKSFAKLSEYYNAKALAKWAKRAMPSEFKNIKKKDATVDVDDIKNAFKKIMKQRQISMKEYGLQIKLGLIAKKTHINTPKLRELIQEYPDYFSNLTNEVTRLKLRGDAKVRGRRKLLLKEIRKIVSEEHNEEKSNYTSYLLPTKIKSQQSNSVPPDLRVSFAKLNEEIKKHIEQRHRNNSSKITENKTKEQINKANKIVGRPINKKNKAPSRGL